MVTKLSTAFVFIEVCKFPLQMDAKNVWGYYFSTWDCTAQSFTDRLQARAAAHSCSKGKKKRRKKKRLMTS